MLPTAGIILEIREHPGNQTDFMFRTLKKYDMTICQRFLLALKQCCKVKQHGGTKQRVILLLAAAHGLEMFAQPRGILLAVPLQKGQVQLLGSGALRSVGALCGRDCSATPGRSLWNSPKFPSMATFSIHVY